LALIVGVIALIGGLSCKDRGTSGDGGVPRSTLDVVKADGRLIIGIGQEAAPFGYREKDELVGFDADIARAVAARLETYLGRKVDVVFRPVTDETRISWVQSGEVHLSLCHTNITRKRLANIDFTVPYGWDGKGVLYDLRKGPRDLKDFAGKVIGIKRSSSSEGEIQAYFAASSSSTITSPVSRPSWTARSTALPTTIPSSSAPPQKPATRSAPMAPWRSP
jgi:polar amino acid transport system substrate-binding protein